VAALADGRWSGGFTTEAMVAARHAKTFRMAALQQWKTAVESSTPK
jgi:hypothetical protein